MGKSKSAPLLKALVKRHRMNTVSFHMPGHKKGQGVLPYFSRLMGEIPFSLDMTEIPGLDDLHNPTGPIGQAQSRAASLFGADSTFFLVNGTTVGIHAAIMTICRQGEEILLPRDIHRSVMGACILAGARPRYLPVRVHDRFHIPYPPTPGEVSEALAEHRSVKAVFQMYPSYYGLGGDLAGIVRAVHSRDIPVAVDEAHGSHFRFSERLPKTALECGADICVQSTHKTLGAFTQSSMLHVREGLVNAREVARQLRILQSTSPSYLLMGSLDAATRHMELQGQSLVEKAVMMAEKARTEIAKIPGIKCLGPEENGRNGVAAWDPTKLFISVEGLNLTGYWVARRLLKKYRIQVEFADRANLLCMVTIGSKESEVRALVRALREIALTDASHRKDGKSENYGFLLKPDVVLTPRQAWFAAKRSVVLDEAVGEISGEMVAPYPPGIPILCPGERITRDIVGIISRLRAESSSFHGPADPTLRNITVVEA